MTRTRILTTASVIYLAIAAVLFLTFLFSQPITAAKAALGFTATAAPPGPTLAPPTSTLEPVATSTPAPTATPVPPTSPPSPPQATSVPGDPTPTVAIILPASGGEAGQSGAIFWVGGGAVLLSGWLLHYLGQARRDAQT